MEAIKYTELREGGRVRFRVWAPEKETADLVITRPFELRISMTVSEEGYFTADCDWAEGLRYRYSLDGGDPLPDPASSWQPDGVHGDSAVVDHGRFQWTDGGWAGVAAEALVIYELHVGTFTEEGTFDAVIPRLSLLRETGITALELMPVNAFPGARNWGYDGVFPYAVQESYGGPEGLKRLVDAAHREGLAVLLDVVYNHLGPEGNVFPHYGPYFTDTYHTPWGPALNFDGPWADGVRAFFAGNAAYWIREYHLDGLRCDAVHAVFDASALPFWELVSRSISGLQEELGRTVHLIAESDLNSPRTVAPADRNGFGFTGQWLDDFHHALYAIVDPEGRNRYYDFGTIGGLAKAYNEGFVHSGEWVRFRKRRFGRSSAGVPPQQFIAFNGNHDQAGNRAGGERLSMLVGRERLLLAAAGLLLSPYLPLLFMGEEYGDDSPFFYFVSHSDESLIEAVRKGRKEEFKEYGFDAEPPDPQAEETFRRSRVRWAMREEPKGAGMLQWTRMLLELRRTHPALRNGARESTRAAPVGDWGLVLHRSGGPDLRALFNFGTDPLRIEGLPEGGRLLLHSRSGPWAATGGEEAVLQEGGTVLLPPLTVALLEYL